MDKDTAIQEIRQLLSTADMEGALLKTRQLLQTLNARQEMIQLDMIQSEWHDVRAQSRNGLLDVDDQVRLNNITRAKLLELVLHLNGDSALAEYLSAGESTPPLRSESPSDKNNILNQTFKNVVKNTFGVLFLMAAGGTFLKQDYLPGACLLVAGIIAFVPTLQLIEKAAGFKLQSWYKYILVIGALLAYGVTLPVKAKQDGKTELRQDK